MPIQSPPPPDVIETITKGALAALAAAITGRGLWHLSEVQRGRRRFWSLELVYELPTAVGMALIGKGAAEYLSLLGWQEASLIAVLAYMGPRGLEAMLAAFMARRAGRG